MLPFCRSEILTFNKPNTKNSIVSNFLNWPSHYKNMSCKTRKREIKRGTTKEINNITIRYRNKPIKTIKYWLQNRITIITKLCFKYYKNQNKLSSKMISIIKNIHSKYNTWIDRSKKSKSFLKLINNNNFLSISFRKFIKSITKIMVKISWVQTN